MKAVRRGALRYATVIGLVSTTVGASPSATQAAINVCPAFVSVAAGGGHSLGLAADGTVWAWGRNDSGQLGDGSNLNWPYARQVPGLTGVTAIAAGASHSLAIANGAVYAWGANQSGQLGDGSLVARPRPVPVGGTAGATAIAAGDLHSFAILRGSLYSWGDNASGQLGRGPFPAPTVPGAVEVLRPGVTAVAAGAAHSLALVHGDLWVWGDNSSGQLGIGRTSGPTGPGHLTGVEQGVTAIAAGARHSLAVMGGTAHGWGDNSRGQVGDGTTTTRLSPVPVSAPGVAVTEVSAGESTSAALADGGVVAWGANADGQVGDGTTTDRPAPVRVVAAGASDVSVGGAHMLAVVGGSAKGWGDNDYGAPGAWTLDDPVLGPTTVACEASATIMAVSDTPDPVVAGTAVSFSGVWASLDPTRQGRLQICRTPSVFGNWCAGGTWASGLLTPSRVAVASYSTTHADIGTHDYYAFVCDEISYCAGGLKGSFTVVTSGAQSYASDSCDIGGTNVLSGFVDDTYVKARWLSGPDPGTTSVCVAAENGSTHVGGRVKIDGATPGALVGVDDDATAVQACDANANNVPVQSGTVLGGQPYWIHVTPTPAGSTDAAWVCIRFTNTLGVRLRFTAGSIDLPGAFTADPPMPHVPAYTTGLWPAAGPSATCAGGVSGSRRYVDMRVGDVPVAMYRWQESPTKSHVCVRAGAAGGSGGRLTVDSAGVPAVTTGTTTAPCPFDVVTRSDTPTYGVYLSNPANLPAVPASACVAVAGTSRSATVSYTGAAAANWAPDPA